MPLRGEAEVEVADLLCLVERARSTGRLQITTAELVLDLYLRDGRVIGAAVGRHSALDRIEPVDACRRLLALRNGRFRLDPDSRPFWRTGPDDPDWTAEALLDAARVLREAPEPRSDSTAA